MTYKQFYIYIMASDSGTLYTGFTNGLEGRVHQHKNDLNDGFTKKYQCHKLVYYEEFKYVNDALTREKQIKRWRREKKENLIRMLNPSWKDLAEDWGKGSLRSVRPPTTPSHSGRDEKINNP